MGHPEDVSLALGEIPVAMIVVRDAVVVAANKLALDLVPWPGGSPEGASVDSLIEPAEHLALVEAARGVEPVVLHLRGSGDLVLEARANWRDRDLVIALRDHRDEVVANRIIDRVAESTIVIGTDGLIRWQSPALRDRIPEALGEGLGINPMERIHPEDLPELLDAFARAVADPELLERHEVRARAPEDETLWQLVEIHGTSAVGVPDLDGVIVQIRTLDEGENLDSLTPTESDYHSLAEAAPIGIVVDDRVGNTVYRNVAAKELLGQHDLHTGEAWRALARREYRPELDEMVRAATEDRLMGDALAPFDVDGVLRWLRVRVAPQFSSAQPDASVYGVITTLEDVTAEVQAREETERLTQMLDATTDLVAVVRSGGEVLYANGVAQAALDETAARGGEGRLIELLLEDHRDVFLLEVLEAVEREDQWRGEVRLLIGPSPAGVVHSAVIVTRRDDSGRIEWFAIVARDISDLKDAENRLRHLATRDGLTGLANRSLASDRLTQAVARQRRHGEGLAVLFCDLDGFKEINDRHGHAAGDQVLVEVAARLTAVIRAADTVARVGGDEFVAVCEGLRDAEQIAELAARIIDVVRAPIALANGQSLKVGISVGVAVADGAPGASGEVDADRMLSVADTAMYRAKAHGGGGYRIVRLDGDV